jgi:hypothetical protein
MIGGAPRPADCSGRMVWPRGGVYFFQENGELRSHFGTGRRIVHVGTHALKLGSRARLWTRLAQHRGQAAKGGNHRGSIFRLLVGEALSRKNAYQHPTWGVGSAAGLGEQALGYEVSQLVGAMTFLWVTVDDEAGPDSLRGKIERNSIALLSNYRRALIDPPSPSWLGLFSDRERVRLSGLWNSNHVDEAYDPNFLDVLETLVQSMKSSS